MKNKISNLENYTLQDKAPGSVAEKRCRFYYLENDYLWKEFDVEGHYTLDEAFEIAKDEILNDLVKMALKESIRSLDLKSKHFHFENEGEIEDLRDYIFDLDILDENTDLFKEYKKLLLDNFNDEMMWYYFRADAMKNANIHDDNDKKTLYNHYFEGLEEFNKRESFLEYCDSHAHYWEVRSGTPRIYYNLLQYGDYHSIDNSITLEELYHFMIMNGFHFPKEDITLAPVTWGAFAYHYGKSNGLSEIESRGFADSLGLFYTDFTIGDYFKSLKNDSIYWDTKKHFKLLEIENVVGSIVSRRIEGELTDYPKEIFFTIFDIYKNRIQDFEYKTKRLEFRVSQRQFDQFMQLEGKSKADKLDSLMKYSNEEVENSLLPDIELDNESLDEWKEKNKSTAQIFLKDSWFYCYKPTLNDKYGQDKEITIINTEGGALSPEEEFIIRDMEEMDKYRAIEEEEEIKAFLEEEAEDARKELEWMKIHDPEEYERQMELSEKLDSMTPEEREEFLKEMFKGLRKEDK